MAFIEITYISKARSGHEFRKSCVCLLPHLSISWQFENSKEQFRRTVNAEVGFKRLGRSKPPN